MSQRPTAEDALSSGRGGRRPRGPRASDSIYASGLPGWRRYARFLRQVFHECYRDDIGLLAAALAHFGLLSIVPLMLVASSVLGFVLRGQGAMQKAVELAGSWLPTAPGSPAAAEAVTVVPVFEKLVQERGTVGGLGLLALLWICLRIFTTLQRALDHIWNIEHHEKRPFYWQYPIALGTVLLLGLFAWLSTATTSLVSSLPFLELPAWMHDRWYLPSQATVATVGVSWLMSVALMFLIYRWLPSARVRARSAVYGAVTAGTVWELGKQFFTLYLLRRVRFDLVYGAMSGVVVVTIWSYFTAVVALFGAEVAFCHARWIAAAPVTAAETAADDGESKADETAVADEVPA
ncbi:MAG: YihY/virulence factor BrkB family protein [Fimbriimonadaceae bacterium]|nr:YihY/virulence factor BrkB family protein [Fimbriimonadaceae bacterium]